MAISSTLPYVYGQYLMNPHLKSSYNTVNKNSFGRLINSYYGKHSLFKKTLESVGASELLAFNDETKELQSSLGRLRQEDFLYEEAGQEGLEEEITTFIDSYNSLRMSFGTTGNETFDKKGSLIDTITKSYEKELSAIGILGNEDGTLTIGENGLEDVDVDAIKAVFAGEDSFASHIMKKAATLGKEALSLLAPIPKTYSQSGSIQYVVYAGTLFNTCC